MKRFDGRGFSPPFSIHCICFIARLDEVELQYSMAGSEYQGWFHSFFRVVQVLDMEESCTYLSFVRIALVSIEVAADMPLYQTHSHASILYIDSISITL